jgi:hypothetical protein
MTDLRSETLEVSAATVDVAGASVAFDTGTPRVSATKRCR